MKCYGQYLTSLLLAVLLGIVLVPSPALAQDSGPKNRNPASAETPAAEVADDDDQPAYTEPSSSVDDKQVGYGAETSFMTWHGYINFEYDNSASGTANFDNHEFYLSAQAVVSRRVSVTAEFEYEHTPEKLILPIQAYADFKVSNAFTFRAGAFFTPLGIPRSYNLRGNRNRMIRQVGVTHDIMFENWSEIGINAFGSASNGLFYDIAVGNGMNDTFATGDSWFDADETLQSHSEDNNSNKAVHGRFGYAGRLFGGQVNTATSFVTQKYDDAGMLSMEHRAVDIRWLHNSGFRIQAEWMKRFGDDPIGYTGTNSVEALGWYAQVSHRFLFDSSWATYLEPVIQVDYIDNNRNTETNGDRYTTAIGMIWSPETNYLIKFEYDIVGERYGTQMDNNKLWIAVVLEF